MSGDLAQQRCFNHGEREAVARCPVCHQFFCRECITEHDDRVICAKCLRSVTRAPVMKSRGRVKTLAVCRCLLGLLVAWFFFYLIGETLVALPASFHEATFWKVKWWHER
jgi:hypothetical protein